MTRAARRGGVVQEYGSEGKAWRWAQSEAGRAVVVQRGGGCAAGLAMSGGEQRRWRRPHMGGSMWARMVPG